MLTYAPNISWLFPELPFAQRPAEVAKLGFTGIEFGFPSHTDMDALRSAREELGLQIVLFNQDVPVWERSNRGYLSDPRRINEFKHKLDEALQLAERLQVLKIMLPAGVDLPQFSEEQQRDCVVQNLLYAAPLAAQAAALLTIEMLNPIDNPGYFLTSSRQAIDIVQQVNRSNIRFQFDTYHIQLMEGHLAETLTENMPWIGHIQFADCPGRHEPGTGEIPFQKLPETIRAAGYDGYIGLEYIPQALGAGALQWALPGR
jgi:hydroxypyruvate isomerase